jgi:hypothetical protein
VIGASDSNCSLTYEICEIGNPTNCSTEYVDIRINDGLFAYSPQHTLLTAPTYDNPTATVQLDNFAPNDNSWLVRLNNNNVVVDFQWVIGTNPVVFTDVSSGTLSLTIIYGDEIGTLGIQEYLPDPCTLLGVSTFNKVQILAHPNPVTNVLTISNSESIDEILVSDVTGKRIYYKMNNNSESEIKVSDLQNGMYFIKVSSNGKQQTLK